MKKFSQFCYRIIRFLVNLFYQKTEIVGTENLPAEPCIIVGNHSQMNGPLVGELRFPGKVYIWCAGEMMVLKDVPAYARWDFWRRKPAWSQWFYRILSYLIAPLAVCLFTNAHTVAVHHDKRILSTYRETLKRMKEGNHILIFPEEDKPYNHILCGFQEGFVDMARIYYKQTGKAVSFVPMYLAPALKKGYIGQPIPFDPTADIKEERERLCNALMENITAMAVALPRHRVVPYNNLPRKDYVFNREEETK